MPPPQVVAELDQWQRMNPFDQCPACEAVYFCCPGLCLQWALCFCNPLTWALYAKREGQRDETVARINELLKPRSMHLKIVWSGDNAEFFAGLVSH